ncbi:MarR family winged helix-turn-helix transcriptional regulator [Rhodopseudomonas sp. B29]|uniref:MarR family winged helix-turn-helix transcriptional regulator n=1 Tax=Rhodopseudomonas sp. B29 TaxID=95607 RepID=UPI00034AB83D|nr:MarR family winged helix-turn-helix transcriptional regulator [Rhodopseudomonas sp. B29]
MTEYDVMDQHADGGPAPGRLPLWSRVGYLVRRLHQIHNAIFVEECKQFGITPVQYGLLTALHYYPGSDQVTLGHEVGIDRTNVADVLERLSERGLVRRERSQRDRRSMIAFLTPAGEEVHEQARVCMMKAQERLLAPLAPPFHPAFLAVLTQLVEGNSQFVPSESGFDVERRRREKMLSPQREKATAKSDAEPGVSEERPPARRGRRKSAMSTAK